jgi:endo-1,4-beta-mannosidase
MAGEEDFAGYIRQVLPNLQHSGATGAILWCYADYVPELWDVPPCQNARHERFFGLVRPDGSLKPHAKVIQEFTRTKPQIQPIPEYAKLSVNPDEYYEDPLGHVVDLYNQYLEGVEST